jgi:GMP/IMP 5'-nucleotidase
MVDTQDQIEPSRSGAERVRDIAWERVDRLLLDMDGTLLDLGFDNHFWQEFVPRIWGEKHGLSYEQAYEKLAPKFAKHYGKLDWYCLDFWAEELDLDLHSLKAERGPHVRYLPEVEAFLAAVRRRVPRVVLVTNAHRGALDVKLAHTGLDQYLDSIYTAHDFGHPKEEQAFWRALLDKEGMDPKRCVLIDDSLPVLEAAQRFGVGQLFTIRRPDSGRPPRKDVGRFPALNSLMELL